MTRILQISNRIPWPLKDGGAMGVYNYTKGYSENGCDVTFATINTKKHFVDPEKLPEELSTYATFLSVTVNTDVKPLPAFLNLFTCKSYNISRFHTASFSLLLKKILTENKFDVIIFESIFVASYIQLVKKLSDATLILREHNVEHRIWERLATNETSVLKRFYLKLLSRRLRRFELGVMNHFDAIMPVTAEDGMYLKTKGCIIPIHPFPAIVDMKSSTHAESAIDSDTIFHIGSMEWMPNIEGVQWFLKEVMPLIQKTFPALKLYLAGRNMPQQLIESNIPGVFVEGEVNDATQFILSKNIMIVPLLSGSGIRVKIIEGMALGKTIISTTIGAEGIHYSNKQNILIADTPDQFLDQIRFCIENPETAKQIGANARDFAVENFSIKTVSANALQFFQSLKKK
ncbi:MAG: glycosyltransferase family 4 protein [Bacteroidota bacterium]